MAKAVGQNVERNLRLPWHVGVTPAARTAAALAVEHLDHPATRPVEVRARVFEVREIVACEGVHERGDFRAAMVALDHDDNRAAAAHFADFGAKHPRDARAEDAAYLRVIALQRAGDVYNMKQAAREYLRRYPTGFRRAEVETLSR